MKSYIEVSDQELEWARFDRDAQARLAERYRAIERSGGRLTHNERRSAETRALRVEVDVPEDPTGLLF